MIAERRYLLERIDDAAVAQIYADGFETLPLKEKTLSWHLYRAAIAGRDIFYDQRYAHSLDMREVIEEILTHPAGVEPATLREVERYTKLFWINVGPYNNLTARKFVLKCTPDALAAAAKAAAMEGAEFPKLPGESLDAMLKRLEPRFFDPTVDPMVTNKTPGSGRDILLSSANNLYAGVTMKDLEGFTERHPLNSRLIRQDGWLAEEVYRIGGRYGTEIATIVRHLEAAIPFASEPMARALRALIQFYRTGDTSDRVAYDIAWVQDKNSPVDTINSFVEVYLDARGHKGAWEGLVFYVNQEKTEGIRRLADAAQWFEDHMPWDPRYRKKGVRGVTARAIDVVIETGDSGPVTPVGINLPNDQAIREQYGSKSVSLSNVNEAYEQSTQPEFRQEFAWTPEEAARAEKWSAFASELTTNMHEVIGHGSGRVSEKLNGSPQTSLKEQYSALEESRADLVALYFLPDPKLIELGLVKAEDHADIVKAEYEGYTRNALVQLRRVREGTQIEEDHMRNRQMIVRWLMANTDAIEERTRDGKTYYTMADQQAFRGGVARLLAEVQRIKAEGDHAAAKSLFETYGVHFDATLRDEVVARVDRLKMPSYTGFVMPRLEAVTGPDGQITDVTISYPQDLTAQMLEYSGKRRPGTRGSGLGTPGLSMRIWIAIIGAAGLAVVGPSAQISGPASTRQAILAIEDARAPEFDHVDTLLDAAKQRDESLAVAAVRALGRLERPSLVDDLVDFLEVDSPAVRVQAADAIGQAVSAASGEPVERARVVLQERLAVEQQPSVRAVIAETLGRLPYGTPESVRAVEAVLVELSLRPGGTVTARQSTSTTALGAPVMGVTIGFDTTRQDAPLPVLLGAVKGLEALIRQNLKFAKPAPATNARLQRLLVTARASMPAGMDQSAADLARVRRLALQALITAGASDEKTIAVAQRDADAQVRRLAAQAGLVTEVARRDLNARAFEDAEPMVRVEAVRAYGRALQQVSGCALIVKATGDQNLHVSLAAIDQLASGCADAGPAVQALLRDIGALATVGADTWHRGAHALVSLARLSPDQARPRLSGFAAHTIWQVRMCAARAAALLGETTTLERLAADPQANVAESAITGLIGLRAHDADPILLSALASPDYQLVRTAARALNGSPSREQAVAALAAALARITTDRRDTSRDPRLAILSTLGALGSAASTALLEPYLMDFDPRIAAEAASILTAWTGQTRDAVTKAFAVRSIPNWGEVAALEAARARILMRRGGTFEMVLHPSEAPATVGRFVRLARQGYYDGLTFHRVVANFVIQGGSPGANEYVGDVPYMRDELGLMPHTRGAVGISTRGRDTGDAQIFIDLIDNPRLDHQYTVFATVVRGMEVVDDVREGDVIERVEIVMPAR